MDKTRKLWVILALLMQDVCALVRSLARDAEQQKDAEGMRVDAQGNVELVAGAEEIADVSKNALAEHTDDNSARSKDNASDNGRHAKTKLQWGWFGPRRRRTRRRRTRRRRARRRYAISEKDHDLIRIALDIRNDDEVETGSLMEGSFVGDEQSIPDIGDGKQASAEVPDVDAALPEISTDSSHLIFSRRRTRRRRRDQELRSCWQRTVWKQIHHSSFFGLLTGQDNMGVYSCNCSRCMGTCAVAFQGSDDGLDWANNLNVLTKPFCGTTAHKGFVNEFESMYTHSKWASVVNGLQGCTEIYAVGHSLGGAVASLFAACVNNGGANMEEVRTTIRDQEIKLVTVGAPAVTKDTLINAHQEATHGQFKGLRVFMQDQELWVDLVSLAANSLGFKHPKVRAVEVREGGNNSYSTDADDASVSDVPSNLGFRHPDIAIHRSDRYRAQFGAPVPVGD